jgi:hypothetical protein
MPKTKPKQPPLKAEQGERLLAQAIGPLGMLLGIMPPQIRLAGREQQPRPPTTPKPRGGKR